MASDSGKFYILVDNRPWLKDLGSRPAHLWQLMVTKVAKISVSHALSELVTLLLAIGLSALTNSVNYAVKIVPLRDHEEEEG